MKNQPPEWKPVRIQLNQIRPWTDNPRMSTREDAEALLQSQAELGQMVTIAVGPMKKGMVDLYDGHQRCLAWNTIKPPTWKALALQSNRPLTDKERRKVALLLHTATGRWDWQKLAGWDTKELTAWGMDQDSLKRWNNDANNLKELLNSEAKIEIDATPDVDHAQQLVKKWKVKQGALYQVGRHRLLCGDSTKPEHVDRVLQGELAGLVFTDPPYGVEYTGQAQESARVWEMLENDNLRDQALEKFLADTFKNAYRCTHPDTALYCFHASKTQREFENALNAAGYEVKQQLIWNKGMSLGRSDYHWAHEPLFYCKKKDQRTHWYGDRTGKTILGQHRSQLERLSKETLIKMMLAMQDSSTTWEVDRDSFVQYVHSTQKPTRLAAQAMVNSSKEDDVVLDFFGGSGSTMVAAENLNRSSRLIELSEGYCAVILQRMSAAFPQIEITKVE